ncbi:MAG: serpin family protein [Gemmatimonadetes bacterium]|nr:serpin family protein [Gemmatimonadota bacterium]
MNNFTRLTSLSLLPLALATCGGEPLGPILELPRELTSAELQLVEVDNSFALKLFREIDAQDPGVNLFISPLSVAMALGMTYNGADGETQAAMAEALELQHMAIDDMNAAYRDLIALLLDLDPRVEFQLANSIWYRNTFQFEQAFLDINKEYFDAEIAGLDFGNPSAADMINDWVNDATNGKIPDIVEKPIATDLVMFLINAIYFKGDWTSQFDKGLTRPADFTLDDGTVKQVETMFHDSEAEVRVFSDDVMRAVDLPYGGDAFTMIILVPRIGSDVDEVVAALDAPRWAALTSGLTDSERIVGLPKFTLEYEIGLNDVLAALGMGVAFTPNVANFSKMRSANDLFISSVKHKTFVDVNEEGTEAAAATSVGVAVVSVGPGPFLVDRPFLFVIRERFSGAIIFMGKILDPDME